MVDTDSQPKWRTDFDTIHQSVIDRLASDLSVKRADIVDACGLDVGEYQGAMAGARKHCSDEHAELLALMGKTPRTARSGAAVDPEELAPSEIDAIAEYMTAGDAVKLIVDTLDGFDLKLQKRILRASCTLLDIEMWEHLAEALAESKIDHRKRGPKPKGARARN